MNKFEIITKLNSLALKIAVENDFSKRMDMRDQHSKLTEELISIIAKEEVKKEFLEEGLKQWRNL